jgi:hypothetical protein
MTGCAQTRIEYRGLKADPSQESISDHRSFWPYRYQNHRFFIWVGYILGPLEAIYGHFEHQYIRVYFYPN